tara:strand:- start:27 stop:275 length:249 start_codon:yes stop_codon:yes gene_type:complete
MKRHCQFTVNRSEKRVDLTVAAEQQPSGVQVVEWVGLVASGFQFLLGHAAVFAEEVGCFGLLLWHGGPNLRLHGMKLLTLIT